jgi:gamma-glutamylcyclotransferase (GGCT)/AIG2-like uncharacterized protein YtfP
MDDLSLPEVKRLVAAANASRRQSDASGSVVGSNGRRAKRQLDALFRPNHTLAVYGTLAPGRPNHHVLAPLGGEWTDGTIEGDLLPMGWGADLGYPGFRPRVGGDAVAVQVLTAPLLTTAWPDLDRFEDPNYERILVLVFGTELGGGRASGGCTRSPTSIPRPRPVPVQPRSNISPRNSTASFARRGAWKLPL